MSVSTTPLQGDTAAGHSRPSIGGEYYTPTLRSALWHAFQQHTKGTKPLPVRPNHRPALSRVRDPKPIHTNTGIEPHPALRSPRRNALSSCRVPSCLSQESTCASLCDVAAGHSRQGHLRVSNAGGSRRSYRNGRASALQRAPPFPRGPQSRLWGGTWLAPVIQRTCWPPPGVSRFRDPKPIS